MVKIIGISGSLRKGSYNAMLLRAAAELAPKDCAVEIGSIQGIPLYNQDVQDTEGIPRPVALLKDQIAASDGLLLVTPEYNNSIPGVFKNAIDWLSRPYTDIPRVFNRRPVGLIGATPSRMGTAFAQTAWLQVIRLLGMLPWFGQQIYLSDCAKFFDQAGKLTDPSIQKLVQSYMAGFAEFVAHCKKN
jgi:chromate reductase, NAD(P)H dehydrogenase (quinone)